MHEKREIRAFLISTAASSTRPLVVGCIAEHGTVGFRHASVMHRHFDRVVNDSRFCYTNAKMIYLVDFNLISFCRWPYGSRLDARQQRYAVLSLPLARLILAFPI